MWFMTKKLALILAVLLCAAASRLRADSLSVETEYRLRGINYSNLDYDKTTSSDSLHYYSQRLRIGIAGKFAPDIEIGSRLTAVGISGSTVNYFNAPYPRTDFTPYVENAYVKIKKLADSDVDLTVGKVTLAYGDGLILGDNGIGYNTIKIDGSFNTPIPLLHFGIGKRFYSGLAWIPTRFETFLSKVSEAINQDKDSDLMGGVLTFDVNRNLFEIGYFDSRDYSGTLYRRGSNYYATHSISKNFLDFRIGKKDRQGSYQFELAREAGSVVKDDGTSVNIEAMGWVAEGKLIGDKTKLGKVEARALLGVFSGDQNPGSTGSDTDGLFSPDYTKKWDGLERAGYGNLFGAVPQGSFLELPASYSGINTLGIGAAFTPLYAWTFGVDYYLFSASQGPKGAPTASGFERIFGAEFSLGIEMDLSAKILLNKYAEMKLSYDRYTPPSFAIYWPKMDPLDRYALEVTSKF